MIQVLANPDYLFNDRGDNRPQYVINGSPLTQDRTDSDGIARKRLGYDSSYTVLPKSLGSRSSTRLLLLRNRWMLCKKWVPLSIC